MSEVLCLLPDSAENLKALSNLGQDDVAASLQRWQAEQDARLRHLTVQLMPSELEVVEEALKKAQKNVGTNDMPNKRGRALYHVCYQYLERSYAS